MPIRGLRLIIEMKAQLVDAITTIEGHMKSILFVGIDVHKNSYSLCTYDKESGEISKEVKITSDAKLIKKYVNKIKEEYKDDITVKCGYEAGCLGFFFKSSRN